jgi:hypothetical protein
MAQAQISAIPSCLILAHAQADVADLSRLEPEGHSLVEQISIGPVSWSACWLLDIEKLLAPHLRLCVDHDSSRHSHRSMCQRIVVHHLPFVRNRSTHILCRRCCWLRGFDKLLYRGAVHAGVAWS